MRPFYVVGHNTNSIENVLEVLRSGANAVEPDVQWNGRDLIVAHDEGEDGPWARDFLRDLGQVARDNPQLCLVVLDNKTADPVRGGRLLRYAREGLAGTNVRVIMSVSVLGETSLFYDICQQMGPGEALMIDQQDDSGHLMDWFWTHGVVRACYGDDNVATAIDHGVALKVQGFLPRWVYTYTLGDPVQMRDALRAGVDGIIVHDANVAELTRIISEPEFVETVRLGTKQDDPFGPEFDDSIGYTVFIQTLDRSHAGTDANVKVTLRGETGGALSTVIAGDRDGRFESGNLNEVSLYGNIGVPVAVILSHDGAGDHPEWLPDCLHVRRTHDQNVYATGLGRWVTSTQSLTRPLGLARYRLKVRTGNVDHAGTDADIAFTVQGFDGFQVVRRINGARAGVFEQGAVDDVYIAGIDVGEIVSVSVFNDGTGDHPGWFLDGIEVYKDQDSVVSCSFQRWVEERSTETALRS